MRAYVKQKKAINSNGEISPINCNDLQVKCSITNEPIGLVQYADSDMNVAYKLSVSTNNKDILTPEEVVQVNKLLGKIGYGIRPAFNTSNSTDTYGVTSLKGSTNSKVTFLMEQVDDFYLDIKLRDTN